MPPPEEWGPHFWYVMHTGPKILQREEAKNQGIVHEQVQEEVSQTYKSLTALFPCPDCKAHYAQLLVDHPPQTSSSAELSHWLKFVGQEVKKNQDRMKNQEIAERAGLIHPIPAPNGIKRISSCAAREMARKNALASSQESVTPLTPLMTPGLRYVPTSQRGVGLPVGAPLKRAVSKTTEKVGALLRRSKSAHHRS
jgi:hypothetical protein